MEWNLIPARIEHFRVKLQRNGPNNIQIPKGRYLEHLILLVNKNKNLVDTLES